MKHISSVVVLPKPVIWPKWSGLKEYMLEAFVGQSLPNQLTGYQNLFDAATSAVPKDSLCYVMVDEAFVQAGTYHRRPGKHVDGYWCDGHQSHGARRVRAHSGDAPTHWGYPVPGPRHGPPPTHSGIGANEALILVSNTSDAVAYVGEYEKDFIASWKGGDVSDLDLNGLSSVQLAANQIHVANVMTIHESLPVAQDCFRSLLRINVPNWSLQ